MRIHVLCRDSSQHSEEILNNLELHLSMALLLLLLLYVSDCVYDCLQKKKKKKNYANSKGEIHPCIFSIIHDQLMNYIQEIKSKPQGVHWCVSNNTEIDQMWQTLTILAEHYYTCPDVAF